VWPRPCLLGAGQTARVRMDNGRIASGTVLDARTVLLAI